jgi:hypothetical protein
MYVSKRRLTKCWRLADHAFKAVNLAQPKIPTTSIVVAHGTCSSAQALERYFEVIGSELAGSST